MKKKGNKCVHVEYLRGYHEVLKYEDVLDIDLDVIYQTYLNVIAKFRSKMDFTRPPNANQIDAVKEAVLDELGKRKI